MKRGTTPKERLSREEFNELNLSLSGKSMSSTMSKTVSPSKMSIDTTNPNFKLSNTLGGTKVLKGLTSKEFDKRVGQHLKNSTETISNNNSNSTPKKTAGSSTPSPRVKTRLPLNLGTNSKIKADKFSKSFNDVDLHEEDYIRNLSPKNTTPKKTSSPTTTTKQGDSNPPPKISTTPAPNLVVPSTNNAANNFKSSMPVNNPTSPKSKDVAKAEQPKTSEKFNKLYEQCKKSNKKFSDPEFPPKQSSLYSPNMEKPYWPEITEWKRVTDICTNPQLFVAGVEAGDVIQGALGDCWFLGALSVVAAHSQLLLECIPQTEINEFGIYEFLFYKNGEWQSVIIDDYIPLHQGKPVFSSCLDPNEVWVMLMEKAYAKLHKTYQNLEGGSEIYALVDMTGGAPETIELDSKETKQEISNGRLWEKMLKYHSIGYLMGCAMIVNSGRPEDDTGQGILQNHAYGLLDLSEVKGNKLIRIRNPWGQGEWTGKWCDNDKAWTPEILKQLNHTFQDDGTFWMDFSDFIAQYNRLYFLRLFGDDWQSSFVRGEWKGESAGGCGNFPTWKNNAQYGFELSQPTEVFMTLMQKDTRMEGVLEGKVNIGFLALKTNDLNKKIVQLNGNDVVGQTQFNAAREVSKKLKLEAGKYIVGPSTFHQKQETSFYLRVYADGPNPLELREVGAKKPFACLEMGSENVRSSKPVTKDKPVNAEVLPVKEKAKPVEVDETPIKYYNSNSNSNNKNNRTNDNFNSSPKPSRNLRPPSSNGSKHGSRPVTPTKQELFNLSDTELNRMQNDIKEVLTIRTEDEKNNYNRDRPSSRSNVLTSLHPMFKRINRPKLITEVTRRISRGVGILTHTEYILDIAYNLERGLNPGPKSNTMATLKENEMLSQSALKTGNSREEALYYYKSALLCDKNNQFEDSFSYYNRFLAVVKEVGDSNAEVLAYNHLALSCLYLGKIKQAIEFNSKHDSSTRDAGSRFVANVNLGICYSVLGDHHNAALNFRQAMGFGSQLGDTEAQSLACNYLAFNCTLTRDYSSAKIYLEKRLAISESIQDFNEVASIHQQIGELLLTWRNEFENDAKNHFNHAIDMNPNASVAVLSKKQLRELQSNQNQFTSNQKSRNQNQNQNQHQYRNQFDDDEEEDEISLDSSRLPNSGRSNGSISLRDKQNRIFSSPRMQVNVNEYRNSNPEEEDDVILEDVHEDNNTDNSADADEEEVEIDTNGPIYAQIEQHKQRKSVSASTSQSLSRESLLKNDRRFRDIVPVVDEEPLTHRSIVSTCSLDNFNLDDRFTRRQNAKSNKLGLNTNVDEDEDLPSSRNNRKSSNFEDELADFDIKQKKKLR